MKRSNKLNRVTWAPGAKLCQIKIFTSEDCPSKVSLEAQHQFQLKACLKSHLNGNYLDGYPTRYMSPLKGGNNVNPMKKINHCIPQIKWQCPPKIVLNHAWCVAAAEESDEAEAQKHREMGVLEAIYPRLTAIPPSPSTLLDVDDCYYDDNRVPPIPITPIEEEETEGDVLSDINESPNCHLNCHPVVPPQDSSGSLAIRPCEPSPCSIPCSMEKPTLAMLNPVLDGDLQVAAAVALTAVMKSKDQASLIDTNLVIEFLRNPKMIEKLVTEHGMTSNTKVVTCSDPLPVASSAPMTRSSADPFKNCISGYGQVVNSKTVSMSEPASVTDTASFASSTAEMQIEKCTNEHGPPAAAHMGSTLIHGVEPITPLLHMFSSSLKPDILTKNSINEHCEPVHSGGADIAGLKHLPSFVSVKSPKPDMDTIKRLINEYGAPDNTRKEPVLDSGPRVPISTSTSNTSILTMPVINASFSSFQRPNSPQIIQNVKPFSSNASAHPSPFPDMLTTPVKDLDYYKFLVKQHGEKQETLNYNPSQYALKHNYSSWSEVEANIKPSEQKHRLQKPCMYFNRPKGCRNGDGCLFKHEMSRKGRLDGLQDTPSAKRLKLTRIITGGK